MTTAVDGLSALSLSLQDAQNTYTTGGGTATSWANWEGTVLSGSNPTTAITSSTLTVTGYYPWLSINLASSTGTGSIYVTLYGWKSPALLAMNLSDTGLLGPFTATQINGMYTTPILLIPAAGPGTVIRVIDCILNAVYGSAAFTGGGNISIYYTAPSPPVSLAAAAPGVGFLTTFSSNQVASLSGTFTSTLSSVVENSGIYLSNATQVFAAGTGATLYAECKYYVQGSLQ